MKFILFAALTLLLLVGCGESSSFFEDQDYSDVIPKKEAVDSAVDWTKLQNRNGVTYLPNANKPFTGYAKQSYDNDQVEVLARFADGYVVRLKQWQENGIPKWEVGYMAGKVGVDQIADGGLEELLFSTKVRRRYGTRTGKRKRNLIGRSAERTDFPTVGMRTVKRSVNPIGRTAKWMVLFCLGTRTGTKEWNQIGRMD